MPWECCDLLKEVCIPTRVWECLLEDVVRAVIPLRSVLEKSLNSRETPEFLGREEEEEQMMVGKGGEQRDEENEGIKYLKSIFFPDPFWDQCPGLRPLLWLHLHPDYFIRQKHLKCSGTVAKGALKH